MKRELTINVVVLYFLCRMVELSGRDYVRVSPGKLHQAFADIEPTLKKELEVGYRFFERSHITGNSHALDKAIQGLLPVVLESFTNGDLFLAKERVPSRFNVLRKSLSPKEIQALEAILPKFMEALSRA